MPYSFAWTCGYRGTTWYNVYGDGATYEVKVRRTILNDEASLYNGTPEEFARDVVGAVGLVHRTYRNSQPIPDAVVAAFNAWRAQEHAKILAMISEAPDRYGHLATDDPIRQPPAVVRGARYVVGTGWAINESPGDGISAAAS